MGFYLFFRIVVEQFCIVVEIFFIVVEQFRDDSCKKRTKLKCLCFVGFNYTLQFFLFELLPFIYHKDAYIPSSTIQNALHKRLNKVES